MASGYEMKKGGGDKQGALQDNGKAGREEKASAFNKIKELNEEKKSLIKEFKMARKSKKSLEKLLIWAAKNGNVKLGKILIETFKVDVNVRDMYKRTPLMHAILNNHPEFAMVLILNGADVNAKDAYGRSTLKLAEESDGRIVEMVREAGALE